MRNLLALVLLCFTGIASAQSYPKFITPQETQTGSYLASTVDVAGNLTPLEYTGVFLEVISGDPDGYVLGYHLPHHTTFNWGFLSTPEYTLLFQSPVPPPSAIDDGKTYPVDIARTVVDDQGERNVILGHGALVYDPLNVGSGGTIDLVINFDTPTEVRGQTYDALRVRMKRLQDNVLIQGCDRSGVDDFSPPPPANACNP